MGNKNSYENMESNNSVSLQEILPLDYNDNYFKQFYLSKHMNNGKKIIGLTEHQMKVHFYKHYIGTYVKNTNEYIKKNPSLYNSVIAQLGITNINSLTPTYVLSDNSKFLQLLYKQCNNETARHNIGQLFYHMLFFNGLTSINKSEGTYLKYKMPIFKKDVNLLKFFNDYKEITKNHFASGWICFIYDKNNDILTLLNTQDHIIPELPYNHFMVFVVDLWEHAYYIDYESDKLQYYKDILLYINWEIINETISYYGTQY